MTQIVQRAIKTALCAVVAAAAAGCSVAGYIVGGRIDGTSYALDSVSVPPGFPGAGSPRPALGENRALAMAKEAPPGSGAIVDVGTRTNSFTGDALTLDTVFAVRGEIPDTGSESLFSGGVMTTLIRERDGRQVSGHVLRLHGQAPRLRRVNEVLPDALNSVGVMFLSDGSCPAGGEEEAPDSAGRFVRIPSLILGDGSPRLYIPLHEVEWIRVKSPVWRLGPSRIILTTLGAGLDVLTVAAVVAMADLGSSMSGWGSE